MTTEKRSDFEEDGDLAIAAGTAQRLSATKAAVRRMTAMRLFLDTLTPVPLGTSEQHQQLLVLSHRRDSREFQLQIGYRWRYSLHRVGRSGEDIRVRLGFA